MSNLGIDITVSIIVPVYKVENEISRCLLSIIQQDYNQIELILVNDCTPDNSFLLAKEIISKYPNNLHIIYLEHEKNRGVSAARNTGITHSKGDYIFFIDSDDELHSANSISILVDVVKKEYYPEIVVGSFQKINLIGEKVEYISRAGSFFTKEEVISQYLEANFWMTAWGRLISRKLLLDNHIFFEEGLLHEDNLWSYFLYRHVKTLSVISEKVYNYYDRDGSIMDSLGKKNAEDLLFIVNAMWEDYLSLKDFYTTETLSVINTNRDVAIKALIIVGEEDLINRGISKLKKIKLPTFIGGIKIIKRNLLFLLPKKVIRIYFEKKFSNKKIF